MIIKQFSGYELTKAQPNTSEDYFNRSEVTYITNGEERTLHVLYVRYFEEQLQQFTPFAGNPVFQIENEDIAFKDIAALACLLHDPNMISRKRVYINTTEEFAPYFDVHAVERLKEIAAECRKNGSVLVKEENKTA